MLKFKKKMKLSTFLNMPRQFNMPKVIFEQVNIEFQIEMIGDVTLSEIAASNMGMKHF